jgi:hypothetical protein
VSVPGGPDTAESGERGKKLTHGAGPAKADGVAQAICYRVGVLSCGKIHATGRGKNLVRIW